MSGSPIASDSTISRPPPGSPPRPPPDSDLAPAIRTAKQLLGNAHLAAFPPNGFSRELKDLLPGSFHIGRSNINQAQLPPNVVDSNTGWTFSRPVKWA